MLRRLITAAALAAVPLLGLTVPATAATTAPGAGVPVRTLSRSCPAGYAEWFVKNGNASTNYYLDAEGLSNPAEVTNTPTCWHAPGTFGAYGPFTDNSGNCLDWDNSLSEVIMARCSNTIVSEGWKPEPGTSGVAFFNKWAIDHDDANNLLAADVFEFGSGVSLSAAATDLARWLKS